MVGNTPQIVVALAQATHALPISRASLRLSAVLCLLAAVAFAQPQPYRFDHWTTDNGLPQNTVRQILQARDGYLWLTTFDGLARFDGVRFTVFDKGNTPAITNNRFTALYEDKDGTLWAGADQGEVVSYHAGVFTSYASAEGPRGVSISHFSRDFNDELLIAAGNGSYYLRAGKFISAPPEYSDPKLRLYRGPSGTRWTIDVRGARQVKDGREVYYPIKFTWDEVIIGMEVHEDSQGNLWVGDRGGVYRLRDGQVTRYTERDGLPPGTVVHAQCEDDGGGVWFSVGELHKDGIGVVRFKDGRFTVYGSNAGLPVTGYNKLIKDREDSIWVATTSGLYRLKKELIMTYSTADGLMGNEVYPLLRTRSGDVWAGTTLGLSLFRKGSLAGHPLNSFTEVIQSLCEDRAGRLWIGLLGGVRRYENGKIEKLTPPQTAGFPVWAILEDHMGAVWVATQRGLLKFEGDRVVAHYTTKDGLPSNDVKVIHERVQNNGQTELWFGTFGGLVQFKDGKFTVYTTAEGLTGNRVRSIYEDAEGMLWIGTYDDGLSRFRDGRFFNYRTEHGLYNNGVFQILEDRRGYFWISCNKGIYRVSRRELNEMAEGRIARVNSVAFGKQDGMLNSECNGGRQPAGFIAEDGKLWFPTMGGVVVIDPEAAKVNSLAPPVVIESVRLERDQLDFGNGVTIQPGRRDLEIAYTGLSFIKPEQVKFKYKLEGLDMDWVDVGTRRVAYFPNLSPGSYTFRVIAANSDGVWNGGGAAVRILVEAPFYRTGWFNALVALSLAAAVLLTYRARIAQLQRRQEEQATFSQRLIESQEIERKRIAAELHDGLGQNLLVIKNRALLGLLTPGDQERAIEQLNEISTAISHTLDEVRQIAANLHPYQLDRLGLTKATEAMIRKVAAAAGIKFSTEVDNIDGLFDARAEINLYRIVQESLNNIVKHSAATEATVAIRCDGGRVAITIRDNGRGFVVEPGRNTGPLKQGFGLAGMSERARMLGGDYAIHSVPGEGTTVMLIIDLKAGPKNGERGPDRKM
jgi:signal transduction histidine kinase/ligand-binding sensor domain-containing protein